MSLRELIAILIVFLCGHGIILGEENEKTDAPREIASPRSNVPPLIVTVQSEVRVRVEEGPDFVLFILTNEKGGKLNATMTVYVGQFPQRLFDLTKGEQFDEELKPFFYERTTWFTWMPEVHGKKSFAATAYLYNVFKTQPNPGTPFIVHVMVSGRMIGAVKEFEKAAEHLRFKGLEGAKGTEE